MSIVLNKWSRGWQFVIVSPSGGYLQTGAEHYQTPEIALSFARVWIEKNYKEGL